MRENRPQHFRMDACRARLPGEADTGEPPRAESDFRSCRGTRVLIRFPESSLVAKVPERRDERRLDELDPAEEVRSRRDPSGADRDSGGRHLARSTNTSAR